MAVNTTSGRMDAGAGRVSRGAPALPLRGPANEGATAQTGPVRSRTIATASNESDVTRQIDRLERLLEGGDIDRRVRRGSYLNILV
jgi:hypothetical protein